MVLVRTLSYNCTNTERNGFRKTAKYGSGVVIQLHSNSLYQNYLKKSNRLFAPPPRLSENSNFENLRCLNKPKNFQKIVKMAVVGQSVPRRKIAFPLRKKSARAKSKNDKAIFLLGSVLTNKAAGLRLRLAGKNFPSQTPPIFAYEPNKRSKNALWLFGAAGL